MKRVRILIVREGTINSCNNRMISAIVTLFTEALVWRVVKGFQLDMMMMLELNFSMSWILTKGSGKHVGGGKKSTEREQHGYRINCCIDSQTRGDLRWGLRICISDKFLGWCWWYLAPRLRTTVVFVCGWLRWGVRSAWLWHKVT